jgi:hypothetical protein
MTLGQDTSALHNAKKKTVFITLNRQATTFKETHAQANPEI